MANATADPPSLPPEYGGAGGGTTLAVDAQGISSRYGDGTLAYQGVTLRIGCQESVGLVGPNGAGKSSLLLSLAGVQPIQEGTLRIFSYDPQGPDQRRRLPECLGLVFQQCDDQLFNPTVLDDVAFGPINLGLSREEALGRVHQALEKVKLRGYESRVPHRLSGGEKRRVALAGILAMQPRFLLLDEPTQDLDPRGRRELIAILADLPQGKLVASHDLDFILATCPRTILFDKTVLADGETAQLLARHDLMQAHGLEVPLRLAAQS
jgi:cobalt/nickel transport system ATP-binding protein